MLHKYNYNHYQEQSSVPFISTCLNAVFDYKQLSRNSTLLLLLLLTQSNAKKK